jgi:hypothetical protein
VTTTSALLPVTASSMFPVKITSAAQVIISSSSAVSVCFFDDIVFLFLEKIPITAFPLQGFIIAGTMNRTLDILIAGKNVFVMPLPVKAKRIINFRLCDNLEGTTWFLCQHYSQQQ